MSYWRFAAMIATSTVVMFGLMYLNTFLLSHVFWSETRAYMALLMGATMAIIMLAFMLSMYSSKAIIPRSSQVQQWLLQALCDLCAARSHLATPATCAR